jgi:tight adherence protein B
MEIHMVPTLATFAVSLLIVLGAYWLFIVSPEERAARKLRGRLKPGTPTTTITGALTRRTPTLSTLKGLDGLLGRSGRLLDPLRLSLERSNLPVTVGAIVLGSMFLAVLMFTVVRSLTEMTWLGALVGVLFGAIPFLVVRVQQFEDQFPQAVDLIASSLRAGHAFTTGVSLVADEVQDPLGGEFRLLYDHQNYGMPLPDALKAFARRVPLLDARFFITAVLTQREAGGNLAEVLDNLSNLIRERSRVKRQVRVASAHGRITGWVLSAMPPILATIMMLIAPEHMRSFVTDPLGVRMIIVAVILQVIGTVAIRRIVNVEF